MGPLPPSGRGERAYHTAQQLLAMGTDGTDGRMLTAEIGPPAPESRWYDPRPPPPHTVAAYTPSTDVAGLEDVRKQMTDLALMSAKQNQVMVGISAEVSRMVGSQTPETINALAQEYSAPLALQPLALPSAPMEFGQAGWWKDGVTPLCMPPDDLDILEAAVARGRQQAASNEQPFDADPGYGMDDEQFYDAQVGPGNDAGGWD